MLTGMQNTIDIISTKRVALKEFSFYLVLHVYYLVRSHSFLEQNHFQFIEEVQKTSEKY